MVCQPEMPAYAVEFFTLFARLEYALTREDMWQENKKTGQVSVDWTKLEKRKELDGIIGALEADPVSRYLLEHPPKKQVIVDGQPGWSLPPPPITTTDQLSVMIRRVRNNLFHGSKGAAATERDENLLRACTAAIKEIAGRLPAVEQRFWPEG
jgi:hypothetical protein